MGAPSHADLSSDAEKAKYEDNGASRNAAGEGSAKSASTAVVRIDENRSIDFSRPGPQLDRMPIPQADSSGSQTESSVHHAHSTGTLRLSNRQMSESTVTEELKIAVRETVRERPYRVQDLYKSGWAKRIATSSAFEALIMAVICMNALWIAYDCDNNHAAILVEAQWQFQVMEHFLCSFYTFEIVVRFIAFERKVNAIKDTWFIFDAVLVSVMITETWILTAFVLLSSSEMDSNPIISNAPIFRLLRLMRLTRMPRIIRILRFMPEVMVLLRGLIAASRSVLCTFMLLIILIYVCAIALVQLRGAEELNMTENYFNDVPSTVIMLLIVTVLPDLQEMVYTIGENSLLLAVAMVVVVMTGALVVLNMLVGVLVDIVGEVTATEKTTMQAEHVRSKIIDLVVKTLDQNADGEINAAEFAGLVTNGPLARAIRDVDVDVVSLVELSDFIYKDCEAITPDRFVDLVLDLRNTNTACVKDVMLLRKQLVKEVQSVVHQSIEDLCSWLFATYSFDPRGGATKSNGDSSAKSQAIRFSLEGKSNTNTTLGDDEAFFSVVVSECSQ